jgi:hypothetical protein
MSDEALDWLRAHRFLEAAPERAPSRYTEPKRATCSPENEETKTLDLARRIWNETVPAQGTVVEAYLHSRGLSLPSRAPLRFHPSCPRGSERLPAMIALMTSPETGGPCGVHRTFLRDDGSGKADGTTKMMLDAAGVIRLSPDDEATIGLGITEGIETSIALLIIAGWAPIWAAASAGGLAKFPVLASIESIASFADRDDGGAGLRAATACAERWRAASREARIKLPKSGKDFLDFLSDEKAILP